MKRVKKQRRKLKYESYHYANKNFMGTKLLLCTIWYKRRADLLTLGNKNRSAK